jgi:hypothetical protein
MSGHIINIGLQGNMKAHKLQKSEDSFAHTQTTLHNGNTAITNEPTNQLPPQNAVLIEKLTIALLVKKFPTFHET